jgi:hypothetical protein
MNLMIYSGAWEKLIHEKKPEVENLVTLSLLGPQEMKKFFFWSSNRFFQITEMLVDGQHSPCRTYNSGFFQGQINPLRT